MKTKQEIFKIYETKLQKKVIDHINQEIGVNIPEKMIKIVKESISKQDVNDYIDLNAKNIIAQTVKTQVAYLVAHQLFFDNLTK